MWSGLLTCLVLFGFWLGQDLGLILDRISLRGLSHAGGVLGFLSVLAADSPFLSSSQLLFSFCKW